MTIRSSINASALNNAWSNFERCADEAPTAGGLDEVKKIAELIQSTASDLIKDVRGLGFKADNCDQIREVEAVLYGYIKESNPDSTVFPIAESCGEALGGPDRERVLSQLEEQAQELATARP